MPIRFKKCRACKETLPLSGFHKRKTASDGADYYCKACTKIECKKRYWSPGFREAEAARKAVYRRDPKNKARQKQNVRRWKLLRNYGLTQKDYEYIHGLQKGCCGICRKPELSLKRSLVIDHEHDTMHIRGLLCDNCNLGIGNFKDSKKLLAEAIKYLTDAPSQ